MTDVLIYETGNGGDIIVKQGANDVTTVNGYENSPYLAMFGGSNWWGNYIATSPYLCKTEAVLKNLVLNSAGLQNLEKAINSDLDYLKNIPGTTYKVSTKIESPSRLAINIEINGKIFSYLWNPDSMFLTYSV